jgi:hypothetical protein
MAPSAQADAQHKPRRQIAESLEVVAGAPPNKGMEVTSPRRYGEQELAAFETAMGVSLPPAYRRYLAVVGAGLQTGSMVCLLEDWCQPYFEGEMPKDFLLQPFPHGHAWNDRTLCDNAQGWQSAYFEKKWFCGSMRIGNLGCEGYDLLVVSGPERGNVWADERVSAGTGIFPRTGASGGRLSIWEYLS